MEHLLFVRRIEKIIDQIWEEGFDGIYFIGSSEDERETVQWYHNQIYEAVKDHTTQVQKTITHA